MLKSVNKKPFLFLISRLQRVIRKRLWRISLTENYLNMMGTQKRVSANDNYLQIGIKLINI
jgi:hypothetical protein